MYDVTLNFKDNQTPTLLGIVHGKKYKADMSVRWVSQECLIYCLWPDVTEALSSGDVLDSVVSGI